MTSGQHIKLGQAGFTLIELVIIIVILGIVAAVAIPRFQDMATSSRTTASREEMRALKQAIVGNPDVVAGGELVDRGFEGDIGAVPQQLSDLAAKPDSLPSYNKFTRLGWNGPYIDSAQGGYLRDAWDIAYVYQPGSRRIISIGGPDSITVLF